MSHPGQAAETAQGFDSRRQSCRLGVACRGEHGYFGAPADRWNIEVYHVSPKQISSAGPVSRISEPGPCHCTVCAPPGAITRSTGEAPRRAMAALALAQVPVPEEEVGPTPRS